MSNLLIFVDTSLSTSNYLEEYTECVNSLLKFYQTVNPDGLLSLATFNDDLAFQHVDKKARDVEKFSFAPSGNTALYDSLCVGLGTLLKFHIVVKQVPSLVIILTDGMDTSSRSMDAKTTALQIARCKARGWRFIFLGMTDHSVTLGRQMGCNIGILYSPTTKSFHAVDEVLSGLVTHMNKVWKDADIDLRLLEESLDSMKI